MTKKEVLAVFERHKGEIISGIDLADRLGITRAAIWKVIKTLREEGYDIESIKKKGYRLNRNSDILSVLKIESFLHTKQYDLRIYKTTDSTNRQAQVVLAQENKEGIVIASEKQEAGVGQQQTSFVSPEGKGVYMSIILKPEITWNNKKVWLEEIKKAIAQAITHTSGIKVQIGEGYHLMHEDKKIGGILSELVVGGESEQIEAAIIGIGIYVYDDPNYEANGSEQSISNLSELTGRYCNRSELIASILNALDDTKKRAPNRG